MSIFIQPLNFAGLSVAAQFRMKVALVVVLNIFNVGVVVVFNCRVHVRLSGRLSHFLISRSEIEFQLDVILSFHWRVFLHILLQYPR